MYFRRGIFIVFEGIDGCGKSTQIKRFADYLFNLDKYNHIVLTRNPYKDIDIRNILKEDSNPLTKAERLAELFIQDREKHVKELILPNLKKGCFVISDRFKLSTIAYQSAQGLDINELIKRNNKFPVPDITFLIDLPVEEAIKRRKEEKERDEQKFESDKEFQEKVRVNYLKIKELLKENIIIIDGNRSVDEIFFDIKKIFNHFITR